VYLTGCAHSAFPVHSMPASSYLLFYTYESKTPASRRIHVQLLSYTTPMPIHAGKESKATKTKDIDSRPWAYTQHHLQPDSSIKWTKAVVPDTAVVMFRSGIYQVGDAVFIEMPRGCAYGVILAMFDIGRQVIKSVIAWVFDKQHARKTTFPAGLEMRHT
jgi:hypothetical protein